MKAAGRLDPQPWMNEREVRTVMAALTAKRQTVRFVGGCVRDSVGQRKLRKMDVDVATPDDPKTVSALLAAEGLKAVPTGIAHGTVSAICGARRFEITTLRVDVETTGRHARIAFTDDWAADAARRDFTMNALYADPDGTLYDPTGGLEDLKTGRVRFIGDPSQRIKEDYLRILRFFRFYAYYGLPPADPAAVEACRRNASGLERLSGERIVHELRQILMARHPAPVLRMMATEEVLGRVVPEATNLDRLSRLTRRDTADPAWIRRLAAVMDGSPDDIRGRAEALRLSSRDCKRLVSLADIKPMLPTPDEQVLRGTLYAMGQEKFRDNVYLRWAEDAAGDHLGWQKMLRFAEKWTQPMFPLSGGDALGLGLIGPAVGEALKVVESWWIAEDFQPNREACLAKLGETGGSRPYRDSDVLH